MNNTGIILKKYLPQKKTVSILDYSLGKITCVLKKNEPILGSLIEYVTTSNTPPYFIELIDIAHVPFETAISDILFLHHVLETCDTFLPPQCPSREIFDLVGYLYLFPNKIKYRVDKKLFLFKLFSLFGLHPEGTKFQTRYFYDLSTENIDNIISRNLHLAHEIDLDLWLFCCITTQPGFSNFKTINFLYENRLP